MWFPLDLCHLYTYYIACVGYVPTFHPAIHLTLAKAMHKIRYNQVSVIHVEHSAVVVVAGKIYHWNLIFKNPEELVHFTVWFQELKKHQNACKNVHQKHALSLMSIKTSVKLPDSNFFHTCFHTFVFHLIFFVLVAWTAMILENRHAHRPIFSLWILCNTNERKQIHCYLNGVYWPQ